MRTRKSTVIFERPFTLNKGVGELPPGSYDIEIDEEEIQAIDRTASRWIAIYLYVQNPASTRTIVVNPADLDSALERDLNPETGASKSGAKRGDGMATQNGSEEIARLRVLLGKLETGTTSHSDEKEKSQLTRETTAENIERIRLRIAELQLTGSDNA
jgi:hypothetical protein